MTIDEFLANQEKIRKRPKHDEDRLQENCIRWFDIKYKKIQLLMHHSPNEGFRSAREGARNRRLGTRKGFPDLILLKSNREHDYLAIELKTATGRQTEEQKAYEKCIEESGGRYEIVRSLAEFTELVDNYLKDSEK